MPKEPPDENGSCEKGILASNIAEGSSVAVIATGLIAAKLAQIPVTARGIARPWKRRWFAAATCQPSAQ